MINKIPRVFGILSLIFTAAVVVVASRYEFARLQGEVVLSQFQQYSCCLGKEGTIAACRANCQPGETATSPSTMAGPDCQKSCKPTHVRCCQNGVNFACRSDCQASESIVGTYTPTLCPIYCRKPPETAPAPTTPQTQIPSQACCKKLDVYTCKSACDPGETNTMNITDGTCPLRCKAPDEGVCCSQGDQYTCRKGQCLPGESDRGHLGYMCNPGSCSKNSFSLRCTGKTPVGTPCQVYGCDRSKGDCDCAMVGPTSVYGVCQ